VASPSGLTAFNENPSPRNESLPIASINEGTERRKSSRRSSGAKNSIEAPKSLADTLKTAIEEGLPLPRPLSSLLFHSVAFEHLLQLLTQQCFALIVEEKQVFMSEVNQRLKRVVAVL
jgi:hypothetical protein